MPDEAPELEDLGFGAVEYDEGVAAKEVVILHGIENMGKTWTACTMPGPIYLMDLDFNGDLTVGQFARAGGVIHRKVYRFNPAAPWKQNEPVFNEFQDDYYSLMAMPEGTVVIDSGSMLYLLAKQVILGRLSNPQRWDIEKVENWFIELTSLAKEHGPNLCITFREKRLYEGHGASKVWKGKYEAESMPKKLPSQVYTRLRITLDTEKDQRRITVLQDKHCEFIEGVSIPYPRGGWPQIIALRERLEAGYDGAEREYWAKVHQLPSGEYDEVVRDIVEAVEEPTAAEKIAL